MRTTFITLLLCCLSLLCISCESEVDLGFPKTISFPKEGGELIIAGELPFADASIRDYDGNTGHSGIGEDGKRYDIFEWLKVEYEDINFNEQLKLYVAPNTTNRRRKVYVEIHDGQSYQEIKITQEK